ncbi:uncharacterized protein [Prorops nasuta]|uniref:uncharacterized protein n=1 Tax=Prorops nasuta TaxID=863751 RepID=UPI0034CDEDCA
MIGKLLLALCILRWTSQIGIPTVSSAWPTSRDESLDERHDAEIFRAVVDSMKEWELHKKTHRNKREVSKVCYEDVGCFEDTGPFSYLEMLPSPPKDVGTRFLVYGSRKARSIPMEVPADDINDNAHRAIDPDLPTKVIVHGFGSGCDQVWVYEMRSALMSVHECNIVCVDWAPGSTIPNYVRAAANTRLVGRQLAKLIRSLDVPLEKVHLIGFSLGAHVAGFAGAELGNVSRITGLDPAGPLFESQDPRARLDETDANFVDVIHSNGEQLILGGLGSWQPMGDVDFYPNGGRMQTGCSNLFLGAVSDIIWSSAVEGRSLCNHRRAYKLFTDSVSPKCRFPAFSCDHGYDGLLRGDCFPCGVNGIGKPCGDMGYYSDESPAKGQLYLVTRDEEPFCAHQYQIRVYNSRSERPTRTYGKLQVTLVGEGSFNDTFGMTRKDEELLVGAILQKIVVPHPAVTNLEAIEIKYTAYSGWISSGLVSWSIDKVAIVDSFGKTLSICKKGLTLESGRSVYLPLYPGECNIPSESENSTLTESIVERPVDEKKGIGPFTKSQNYEVKDGFSVEAFSSERSKPEKSLGPFTKEQNLRIGEEKPRSIFTETKIFVDPDGRRVNGPWNFVDLPNDGNSNSLENTELERGRGFSGSNYIQKTSSALNQPEKTTTEYLPEIQEPVLQLNKKETGRSLKLPEITEPILRPRPARQNFKAEDKDEIQETSSTSTRGFTVQFLPERLAGILAQAERYARQTLLPLISQYTPSFVGGGSNNSNIKHEETKYFPPLGEITVDYKVTASQPDQLVPEVRVERTDQSTDDARFKGEQQFSRSSGAKAIIIEAVYPEKGNSSERISRKDEWIPLTGAKTDQKGAAEDSDLSRSSSVDEGRWTENGNVWLQKSNMSDIETKIDDWTPVTRRERSSSTPETLDVTPEVTDRSPKLEKIGIQSEADEDRKFIPLINFEDSTRKFINNEEASTEDSLSHIQKIPRSDRINSRRSLVSEMIFPYAYEKRKDPSTRYIPLLPIEDMGGEVSLD